MFLISSWKKNKNVWYRDCEDTCPVVVTKMDDEFIVEVSKIVGSPNDRYICPISATIEVCKSLESAKIMAVVLARSEGYRVLEL